MLQMCIDLRHIHMCSVDKVAGSITGYRCCPQAATKYGAGEWIPPPDSATLIIAFLQDLEDTTGSWELYGQEDDKRYPSLQAEFFNRAAGPLTRRESILAFTFVGELTSQCSSPECFDRDLLD